MLSQRPSIVVLGAGPAGLGAAYQLAHRDSFDVTVVERADRVGGNAGSFDFVGLKVDYGSHRLHPSCRPDILADIRSMLGDDLLDRPRHGRILIRGRWVHFPLRAADLALSLPLSFSTGVAFDALAKPFSKTGLETFAEVLEHGLGRTICREFYFPYAEKIWGVPPADLDAEQARRRVSASSIWKMARKILDSVPGPKATGAGRFYYPRGGYGRISAAYSEAAVARGAKILLGSAVTGIELDSCRAAAVRVRNFGSESRIPARHILSTIPLPVLVRSARPAAPSEVLESAASLRYRAMVLVYLALETEQFSEYDAHYFPGADVRITRLSEPKNYGLGRHPGVTVLCAEIPCTKDDRIWRSTNEEMRALLTETLARVGLPIQTSILAVEVRRLPEAYPIYLRDYRRHFERLDSWVGSIEGLLTLGRQGLFAHDNTHHALAMAYEAVACLDDSGCLDEARWARHRREFESHVVED